MPIKQQSKKALRQTIKRTARNIKVREDIKTIIKKIRQAIEKNEDKKKIEEMLKDIQKKLDKAAQKKIFKKNTAGRKLSRLVKNFRKGGKTVKKEAEPKKE